MFILLALVLSPLSLAAAERSHFLCQQTVKFEHKKKVHEVEYLHDRMNVTWAAGDHTYTLANYFLKADQHASQPVVQLYKRTATPEGYVSLAKGYSVDLGGRVSVYEKAQRFWVEQNGLEKKLWNSLADGSKGILDSTITELSPGEGALAKVQEEKNVDSLDPVPGVRPISSLTTCDIFPSQDSPEQDPGSLFSRWVNSFDERMSAVSRAKAEADACLAGGSPCEAELAILGQEQARAEAAWAGLVVKRDLHSLKLIGKRIARRKAAERAALRSSGAMGLDAARRAHCMILQMMGSGYHPTLGQFVAEACRRGTL